MELVDSTSSQPISAANTFAESLFLHVGEADARLMAATMDQAPSGIAGIVIGGVSSFSAAKDIRRTWPDVVVLAEPENPGTAWATPEAPFFLNLDGLFSETLENALDDQLLRGSPVAITPTKYIRAGDSDSLKAVQIAISALDRSDTLAWFPLDHAWLLNPTSVRQLVAVLKRVDGHPVAVSFGDRRNPFLESAASEGLASLCSGVPRLTVLRTDHLGSLETLARSGGGSSFGLRPSHRRITPPGTAGFSKDPKNPLPHIGLPELHSIVHTTRLKDEFYVNVVPPTCSIPGCDPRRLDGYGGSKSELLAAHLHNLCWVAERYRELRLVDASGRLQALTTIYANAIAAYSALGASIGHPVKPPDALTALHGAGANHVRTAVTTLSTTAP